MSVGTLTGCDFLEGNGNLVAVVEQALPQIDRGYYQLRANPRFFEIVAGGQSVARFDMPNQSLFQILTHLSEIAVIECPDGYWPGAVTNAMYVQTSREVLS